MQSLAQRLVGTMREHLAGGPPLPPEGSAPLWNAFNALSAARTWHASGPNPISYPEIEAYVRLTRWPFEPHRVAGTDECALARARNVVDMFRSGLMDPNSLPELWTRLLLLPAGEVAIPSFPVLAHRGHN